MSLNIPKRLLDVCDVRITVNVDSLSARQQASFHKMCKTGVLTSGSVPATMARAVLAGRPYMRVIGQYVQFWDIPVDDTHPLRAALLQMHAVAMMDKSYVNCVAIADRRTIVSNAEFVAKAVTLETYAPDTGRYPTYWMYMPSFASKAALKNTSAEYAPFEGTQVLIPRRFV